MSTYIHLHIIFWHQRLYTSTYKSYLFKAYIWIFTGNYVFVFSIRERSCNVSLSLLWETAIQILNQEFPLQSIGKAVCQSNYFSSDILWAVGKSPEFGFQYNLISFFPQLNPCQTPAQVESASLTQWAYLAACMRGIQSHGQPLHIRADLSEKHF